MGVELPNFAVFECFAFFTLNYKGLQPYLSFWDPDSCILPEPMPYCGFLLNYILSLNVHSAMWGDSLEFTQVTYFLLSCSWQTLATVVFESP